MPINWKSTHLSTTTTTTSLEKQRHMYALQSYQWPQEPFSTYTILQYHFCVSMSLKHSFAFCDRKPLECEFFSDQSAQSYLWNKNIFKHTCITTCMKHINDHQRWFWLEVVTVNKLPWRTQNWSSDFIFNIQVMKWNNKWNLSLVRGSNRKGQDGRAV